MNKPRKGNFIFKPRARIIKTIGEELISNDNVAVIELVKNSYDAESPIVEITFNGDVKEKEEGKKIKRYIDRNNASIIIYDEGKGMDFETIETAWMEPATNFKKKGENQNSLRKFTGEKGIGRFASAKLASKLELITKQESSNEEIVVNFNWDDFSDEEKYLEKIQVDWEIREAKEIKKKGTILKLLDLNNDWDEDKIRELRVTLSRLLNPIVPTEDFLISLSIPKELDKNLNATIERPETLNKPDYYIKGTVSKEGRPEKITFFSKNIGNEEALIFTDKDFLLKDPPRASLTGKFSFEFRIWNRDDLTKLSREVNSTVKNVKKDLDDLSGISIYRDNVRVLPYGNKNNDWARLDIRRVNNPTLRLSNNQIVGYISIGLDSNPLLKDQSNREGIVEGQALEDLKELIKLILNEVEQRRYSERPRENDKQNISQQSLFEKFSLSSISTLVKEKIPENKQIIEAVEKKDVEIKESLTKVQDVISRYRRLTTLGQLIDAVVHDGGNYLNKIDMQATILTKEMKKAEINKEKILEHITNIQNLRKDFAQLFRRIEPFGGRRRGRPKNIVLEDVINNQFLLSHIDLEKLNISYSISETKNVVTMDEAELGIIFMNLIQNSIYWLEDTETERMIKVEVERSDLSELIVIFSDSGPGIKDGTEADIFDPYFSTKPDGIGLGLAMVGELISEYNGEFMLINNGPLEGATFKITFRYRI
ncbi:histidine kinase [Elizabethkingia anophelis]|uniref:sensor histidine kinase n=1 Tax=Elizabethkingia anophelis TaxID=1117645 RepID=UPI0021A5AD1A|nr:ATP-binding protein [Elizabethkingia anophelis]MDV3626775.1 histidine kinase [Elizabethkingia anophelis]MDV3685031.1 histidine kinase [Elizabethkingia anophelis]MDV3782539.1 histidine kinase [Elizabethkingia anophelis]MDV3807899.1 histidine kinase [Elizabethkingia anophelis]